MPEPTSSRVRCWSPDGPVPAELVEIVLDRYDAAAATVA